MSLQAKYSLDAPTTLTPFQRQRKKRPSCSPIKSSTLETPAPRFHSNPSTAQKFSADDDSHTLTETLNTGMASLQFEEFSYDDEKGGYTGCSMAMFSKINDYVIENFPVVNRIEERIPYMLIWCNETIPPPEERPFMIAGLLGVWLLMDGFEPPELEMPDLGNLSELLDVEDLAEDLKIFNIPRTETLCTLMDRHFPYALAVSYLIDMILIELPEVPLSEHCQRLQELPGYFEHEGPALRYTNGLRSSREHKRLIQPEPETLNGQCDDSDYVAADGYFQPGAMISDKSGNSVTAGILVEKGNETRMTVSIHCWQKELDEIPERMGDPNVFTIKQGKSLVGYVSSRFGNTDIGLATLNPGVEFRNNFLDLPGAPKTLLHSDDLRLKDVFMIDSFSTGRQSSFQCQGKRVIKEEDKKKRQDPQLKGDHKNLLNAGTYNVLVQGAFATGDALVHGMPIVRDGCCGSAVVRLVKPQSKKKDTSNAQVTPSKQATPSHSTPGAGDSTSIRNPSPPGPLKASKREIGFQHTGEVGGFMHLSDLQSRTHLGLIPKLLCYAEVMDPLITDGWSVATIAEKRKQDAAGIDDEDPFTEKTKEM
jgi:hypothetical protein